MLTINYSYYGQNQITVFKNSINRLLLIKNVLLHLTAENAVLQVISSIGDVVVQHVEEVAAHS